MESIYRPPTKDSGGECVNILPLTTGELSAIEPTKNADLKKEAELYMEKMRELS